MNVSGSSKSRKKRITDDWIIENKLQIGGCKNREELNLVADKAKRLFGYSVMYNPSDLAWTIIRAYCRIYKMTWDHKKERFKAESIVKI